LSGYESEQAPGDGEGQRSLSCSKYWRWVSVRILVVILNCSFARSALRRGAWTSRPGAFFCAAQAGDAWAALFNEKIFINFNGKMIHLTPNPRYPQIFRDTKLSSYDVENTIRAKQIEPVFLALTDRLLTTRRSEKRQQRPPGGNKPQQHGDHPPGSAKHNRDHQKSYQGGSAPHPSGRSSHHGYSQNRRWHHSNMEHPSGDKGKAGAHRNAKETVPTESPRLEDALGDAGHGGLESPRSPDALAPTASERLTLLQPGCPEAETKLKDSIIPERGGERPKITLLQSSKDRLRRRLKEKVPDEVAVETTSPQQNKMDKLIEILNSMRNNSSDVDAKLTTFMEEAQNSTNSEEMLGEIVRTIYQKAVSDRSFAFTAAKLCDKMALFMVEGTKFRSLLLNMLQPRVSDGASQALLLCCSRKESRGRNSSNPTFLMTHRGVSFHLLSFSGKPDICPFPGPQHLPPMPPAPNLSPSEVHTPLQALRVHCLWIPSQPPVQFSHP
ncbi:hypothetical protein FD755_010321, partial [Muntiacus reevesi]